MAIKATTIENKYKVADALAKAYNGKFDCERIATEETYRKKYVFGVIVNSVGASGKKLGDVFNADDAAHIVNLTITKLCGYVEPATEVEGF